MPNRAIRNPATRQRGIAAMMTMIFLLVVIGFAAVILLRMSSSDLTDSTAQGDSVAALFLAESALERASYRYRQLGAVCNNVTVADAGATLGRGTMQVISANPINGRCRVVATGQVNTTRRRVQADIGKPIALVAINPGQAFSTQVTSQPLTPINIPGTAIDRALVVGVSIRRDAANQQVTGITYTNPPGPPMSFSLVGAATSPTNARAELWVLPNPPTGTNTVTINLNPGARFVAGVMAFSGVDQTFPFDPVPNAYPPTGFGGIPAFTANISRANAWAVDVLAKRLAASATVAGAGHTQRWSLATTDAVAANNILGAASTNGPVNPIGGLPGLANMNWNSAGAQWARFMAELRPAPVVTLWQER